MGFDGFNFSSAHLEVKKYTGPPAVICDCGKPVSEHTIRGKRVCREETE